MCGWVSVCVCVCDCVCGWVRVGIIVCVWVGGCTRAHACTHACMHVCYIMTDQQNLEPKSHIFRQVMKVQTMSVTKVKIIIHKRNKMTTTKLYNITEDGLIGKTQQNSLLWCAPLESSKVPGTVTKIYHLC